MGNMLIITNADMSLQSGNVVLINRRAEEIFVQFNIRTTCIVLKTEKCINHNVKGIDYVVALNREDIKKYISTLQPKIILFYGIGSFIHIKYVKNIIKDFNYGSKILLDIQGALEESIEYEKGISLYKNYFKYLLKKRILYKAINTVNGVFVVSDEMKDYCTSFLNKSSNSFELYKIRCGINEVISTDQKLQWKEEIRKEWGIDNKTIVMTFSGYRKPWQNIDQIINIFQAYDKRIHNVFFAFFCDSDEKFQNHIKKSFPKNNCILKFLSFGEYFKYLSACDIGFLVRDKNITNRVAFPNKFSDYLNAGLMVAISKALPEPYRILQQYKIEFIDVEESYESNIEKIQKRQEHILDFYRNTEQVCKNELLYSVQISNIEL